MQDTFRMESLRIGGAKPSDVRAQFSSMVAALKWLQERYAVGGKRGGTQLFLQGQSCFDEVYRKSVVKTVEPWAWRTFTMVYA
eukprot:6172818-Pleurochrysis_carterae.AAC.1